MELRRGGRGFRQSPAKVDSSFLTSTDTTLVHSISDSEKKAYVDHINMYLDKDPVLQRVLPIDASTNQLFGIIKDGVLLWYVDFSCEVNCWFKKKTRFAWYEFYWVRE
jgi:hypothetical protein